MQNDTCQIITLLESKTSGKKFLQDLSLGKSTIHKRKNKKLDLISIKNFALRQTMIKE